MNNGTSLLRGRDLYPCVLFFQLMSVNGACAENHTVTDGSPSASSKRTGWIASLFGSSKPSTSSNSSQESEEMSETDGSAKKEEQAKKEEHITVPAKGKFLSCVIITLHSLLIKLLV